jgi:signal transduction histidine kinase
MVGGWLLDPEVVGRRAGELAVRVLQGTPAHSIPVEQADDVFRPVFDARALQRFAIARSTLPPGAEILFDEVSGFERYRWQILTGIGALVVQAGLIGVLLAQRRRRLQAQARLDSRLRFEQLVSEVAATLSRVSRHEKPALARLFEKIGVAFGADRVGVMQWLEETPRLTVADVWRRPELAPQVAESFDLPTVHQAALRGEVVRWNSQDDVPRDSADREAFNRAGANGALIVPVARSGHRVSSMGIGRPTGKWTDEEVERVKALAEHFSAWVRRQWAEADAETSNALNAALVDSIASRAAIVDADGVMSWISGERGPDVPPWLPRESGVNILQVLEPLAANQADAAQLLEALRSVRADPSLEITTESRFTADAADRYCEMHVRTLHRPDGGLAVTFHDVTRNRLLELDNQARLHEIAHLDRVASLGALATSLAHELNQPLTAILTNAQAAQVLLENGSCSPDELGEVLTDIVEDDRRAGDIIYRMRRMLKKGAVQAETVDLNAITHDAIRLVAGRAARQRVTIEPLLSRLPVRVSGDSVQLQQVIVNLLLNAIDATAQRLDGPRRVTIETRTSDREAQLAVSDTGTGVDAAGLTRLFRPFFSTKQEGLGVGLSISRTIVETHRGRIWAENGSDGAVFYIAFARAAEEAA